MRDTGVVLRSVSARQSALQQLVTAGERVFATTAARNRDLTATVNALAPLLPALRTTLDGAHHALALADPTIRTLLPVAPLVAPTLARADQARAAGAGAAASGAAADRLGAGRAPRADTCLDARCGRCCTSCSAGRRAARADRSRSSTTTRRSWSTTWATWRPPAARAGSAPAASCAATTRVQPVFSNQLLFGQTAPGAGDPQTPTTRRDELARDRQRRAARLGLRDPRLRAAAPR